MNKHHKFSLDDVEAVLQPKTWWASLAVLPVANRLVLVCVNYLKISPNLITGTAFLFRCISGVFFLGADYFHLATGALCWYMAYCLDCVDGPVARLTAACSESGRYFDHISDLAGDLFVLFCIAQGRGILFSRPIIAMGLMHVFEAYTSYLAGIVLSYRKGRESAPVFSNGLPLAYQRYRNFFFSRNFKSFISFPDYTFMVFIVFPLMNRPIAGLATGFYCLVLVCVYTCFSSFWAIHSGDAVFP
jgi:phosphatidylglycerophosphate synthase